MTNDEILNDVMSDEAPLTAEEKLEAKRKENRERKRKQRNREKLEAQAQAAVKREEFWEANLKALPTTQHEALQAQHAYLVDVLVSMRSITDVTLDPDLVPLVVDLVKEHGVVHLSGITKDQDIHEWGEFWKNPALMLKLEAESPSTKVYVNYGLLSALPDFRVTEFLQQKAGWTWYKAAALVGQRVDHNNRVSYR